MASRLSDRLLAARLASPDAIRSALARQAVYGGALDTALLELDAVDESALWQALSGATDLPVPDRSLLESPQKMRSPSGAAIELDVTWSERCRAVPVGWAEGAVQVLCGEPVARAELDAAAAALRMPFLLYAAPEVWLAAVRQAVFGRAMPPRLVRLFARVVGASPVRQWQAAHAPPRLPDPSPAIDPGQARFSSPPAPVKGAPSARSGRSEPTGSGAASLDRSEVPALIARLDGVGESRAAAYAALVTLTKQDFGTRAKRWLTWWDKHQDDDRVDWLFDGLSHKAAPIRAAAEHELRALTGQYFGYHFDLSRAEREAARRRWQAWWTENRPRRSSSG
jgi:hypothetical protein